MDIEKAQKASKINEDIIRQSILLKNMEEEHAKLSVEETSFIWHKGYRCFEVVKIGRNQTKKIIDEARALLEEMHKALEEL